MSAAAEGPDADTITFVKVYSDDGGYVCAVPEDEPMLDAAVQAYLDSGETRDTLVHLTLLDGDRCVVRASHVTSWVTSTPDGRTRGAAIDAVLKSSRPTWQDDE